jgi:hypothetical protein
MLNKQNIIGALFLIDKWLQRELPVLFEDSLPVILGSAWPFLVVGVLATGASIASVPHGWYLPWNWTVSLLHLPNPSQIMVYLILTILMVVCLCYSVGLFLAFWIRLSFRFLLHRNRVPGRGIL